MAIFREVIARHLAELKALSPLMEAVLAASETNPPTYFSRDTSDIRFIEISTILDSHLLKARNLPDSVQLRRISNLGAVQGRPYDVLWASGILKAYYPDYAKLLADYKLDEVGSVYSFRNLLISWRGLESQEIKAFGAEISSRLLLIALPLVVLGLYMLMVIYLSHLGGLFETPRVLPLEAGREAVRAPLFVAVAPTWLAHISVLFPALIAFAGTALQFAVPNGRIELREVIISMGLSLALLTMGIFAWLRVRYLRNVLFCESVVPMPEPGPAQKP
jgi:hypothetical protein